MANRYRAIIADPPWSFDDELKKMRDGTKRGASSQYPVLDIAAIAGLPVGELSASDGCMLALWCPSVLLPEGLRVMKHWGFDFKGTFVWVKTKKQKNALKQVAASSDIQDCLAFGMGRLFRQTHEIALIGTSGKGTYTHLANNSQRSVCFDENQGHSIKPDNLHRSLEAMFPSGPFLELFARRQYPGWDVVGNEVCNGEDIRDSLVRLTGKVV